MSGKRGFKHVFMVGALAGLSYHAALAQDNLEDYDHYTVNNGLPTQTTYNLIQDRRGFLWIGTDAGVSCFDGKKFANYTTLDGLGDNEILNIFEDWKGRIWFLPFSGKLSYYSDGKFYNEDNDPLLKNISARAQFADPVEDLEGNLFIPGKNLRTIIRIDTADTVTGIDLSAMLDKGEVVRMLYRSRDKEDIYCISSRLRLFLLSGGTIREIKSVRQRFRENIFDWYPNFKHPERLLYLDEKGVYRMDDSIPRFILPADRVPYSRHTFAILIDSYNHIWTSNLQHNTFFLRNINGHYAEAVPVLKHIFAINTFDSENNIWFCTANQGIYKISYSKFLEDTSLFFKRKLMMRNILCAHRDAEGTLWVGYGNGYITQISGKKVVHHNINLGSRTYNRVVQIISDKEGDIWCATDESAIVLKRTGPACFSRPASIRFRHNPDFIVSTKGITFDRKGTAYAITPNSQLRVNKKDMFAENSNIIPGRVYSIFFDTEGGCYLSTVSGVRYLRGKHMQDLAAVDNRLKIRVQHFAEATDGTIFLASHSDGLIALNNNRVTGQLTKAKGLAGVICRRVYLRHDTIFVATNRGITVSTFHNKVFRVIRNIGLPDGLPSTDVNDLAFSGNTLYAATSEGMAALPLYPATASLVTPPTLTILGFKVNETAMPLNNRIVFPYNLQRIRIEYIAPVMEKAEMVSYRYRFLGRDGHWQLTSSNLLEFNDLPYGNFLMEIQARKYNSSWSASRMIAFIITPPYYSTWWFLLLVILAAGLCLSLVLRSIFVRRFRIQLAELKQREAVHQERNRIAADIHDDIGSELTNIVIQARILRKSADHKMLFTSILDKLERSSNEVINKMNEVIWTLNTSNDSLHNLAAYLRSYIVRLLGEYNLQGTVNIDDSVYTERVIKADLSRNIFLIIKETLHNVVKHSGARQVEVLITLNPENRLFLQVRDNGAGFDPRNIRNGNGLNNIRKRASAINGTVNIYSQPGAGCEVSIIIPI